MTVKVEPCRRSNGTFRAHFTTKEDAEAFANDPANWPTYENDIAHKCRSCPYYHLSAAHWLCSDWFTVTPETALVN